MSHWTTVQASIRDLDSLEDALKKMGYKNIKRNTTCRGYGGSTRNCDLVVVGARDRYDIGFKLNGDKTEIVGDFSMMGVNEKKFRDEVTQKYSYAKILKALKKKGYTGIRERVEKDGTIKLSVNLRGQRYS